MLQNRILDIVKLLFLVALQVFILNNINLLGYADPYVYILFILLLPLDRNKYLVLTYAFVMGILIDFFENMGGINAAVTVFIAFLRYPLATILQSKSTQYDKKPKLYNFSILNLGIYFIILIFLQHFLIDLIQTFSFNQWENVLKRSAIASLLTLIIGILYLSLFPLQKNQEL